MSFLRPLLAIAVLLGAIVFASTHTAHHATESPFIALYSHLTPAPLVADPHAERPAPLLEVTIPGPAAFDHDHDPSNGTQVAFTNLQLFQVAALLLIVILFSGVPGHLRRGGGDWLTRLFAGFAQWVRDEMVYPVMGAATGKKLLPFFLTQFFFILFMNLLGLVPGAATATASIYVTAALAVVTLLIMVVGGMAVQGPLAYWKHLTPHVPAFLVPLLFVLELVGLFVKPFALTIRLFANMTGGHMVVLSFMGLLFFLAARAGDIAAYATSPVIVGFAVFIMIIESFVALLQAYVFTMLSILFVQASFHPEH